MYMYISQLHWVIVARFHNITAIAKKTHGVTLLPYLCSKEGCCQDEGSIELEESIKELTICPSFSNFFRYFFLRVLFQSPFSILYTLLSCLHAPCWSWKSQRASRGRLNICKNQHKIRSFLTKTMHHIGSPFIYQYL